MSKVTVNAVPLKRGVTAPYASMNMFSITLTIACLAPPAGWWWGWGR